MVKGAAFVIVTFLFGATFCAPEPGLKRSEIVGGQKASITALPYQVSVQVNGFHWCGGSLIEDDIIVTAAHCTIDCEPWELSVRAGTSYREKDGEVINVKEIINHEKYNHVTVDYDVALLKLEKPFKRSNKIRTIKLSTRNQSLTRSKATAVVSGWGKTKENGSLSNTLMVATVPLLKKEECVKLLPHFSDRMICAGYKKGAIDACQSDSGGPLVVGGKLVGIVSWGAGCARAGLPGVYTDVSTIKQWIDDNVEKLKHK